jgi:hypothetical protein
MHTEFWRVNIFRIRLLRRLGKRWEDNNKLKLMRVDFEDETWKELVQHRVHWRIFFLFWQFWICCFYYQGLNDTHVNIQCTDTFTTSSCFPLSFLSKLL